jgi:cell division protein FtsQ
VRGAVIRIGLVALCAAVFVAGAAAAPAALRKMAVFRVEQVEIVGARHLDAESAVAVSGLVAGANLFDDDGPWRAALLRHPLIRQVGIERRVPGTVVLHVAETQPVAFARTPELRPIDERGRLLPVDPAADGLDLPVLLCATRAGADGSATDEETLRVVRFLGIVARLDPGLLAWISEAGPHEDAIRIVLRNATDAEVLVTAEPTAERLAELQYALADLAAPRFTTDEMHTRDAGTALARVRRIDGRFHDQVVVALHPGKN